MWTMTKSKLMYVCAVSLMLSAPSGGWANNLSTEKVGDTGAMNKCETGSEPSALAPQVIAQVTSPSAKPDERSLKIVSIDPVQGKVTAQSIATGKIIHFNLASETLKRHKLRVGQTIGSAFIVANGIQRSGEKPCKCGQHLDGSCACACDVAECVIYCLTGECRGGVTDGKTTIQTPGGGGYRP